MKFEDTSLNAKSGKSHIVTAEGMSCSELFDGTLQNSNFRKYTQGKRRHFSKSKVQKELITEIYNVNEL